MPRVAGIKIERPRAPYRADRKGPYGRQDAWWRYRRW